MQKDNKNQTPQISTLQILFHSTWFIGTQDFMVFWQNTR